MPLRVGSGAPTPPTPTPAGRVDAPAITWTDPTGTVWDLGSPFAELGWFTVDGPAGIGAALVTHTSDPLPRGGSRVRHSRPEPRVITLPLHVWGDDHAGFLARWRAIVVAFTSTRRLGAGTLRFTRPDATAREIRAVYESGLSLDAGAQQGILYANPVVQLFCEDPFWRDIRALTESRAHATAADYFSPYRTLSSGRTLGATTVYNAGDVEAWPTWTITGPAEAIEAVNDTTDEAFTLTFSLAVDETITIVTDPTDSLNPPTVLGPASENLVGSLNWPAAVLWGLAPGPNDVTYTVTGADAGTTIALSYRPRYETA